MFKSGERNNEDLLQKFIAGVNAEVVKICVSK